MCIYIYICSLILAVRLSVGFYAVALYCGHEMEKCCGHSVATAAEI